MHRIRDFFAQWQLKRRERLLYRNFLINPKTATLAELLNFAVQNDRPFSVASDDFSKSLFSLDWKECRDEIDLALREIVFQAVDASSLHFHKARVGQLTRVGFKDYRHGHIIHQEGEKPNFQFR